MRPLTIIRSIPVQTSHDQYDGDAIRRRRFLGDPDVQRDTGAICAGGVLVRNDFFLEGWFPQGSCGEVDLLLAVEGETFEGFLWIAGVAHVGEAGDAEDYGGAAVEV